MLKLLYFYPDGGVVFVLRILVVVLIYEAFRSGVKLRLHFFYRTIPYVQQIPNQLHYFTKIRVFLHGRCKKSLLDVKNLPVD